MKPNWVVLNAMDKAVYWAVYTSANASISKTVSRAVDVNVVIDEALTWVLYGAMDLAVHLSMRGDIQYHTLIDFLDGATEEAP